MNTKKKGDRFERFSAEWIRRNFVEKAIMFPPEDVEIKTKHKIRGVSGTRYEFDIVVARPAPGLLAAGKARELIVVAECKDYLRHPSLEKMSAFAYKVRDVRAQYGIFLTTKRVQPGARSIARHEHIRVFDLGKEYDEWSE